MLYDDDPSNDEYQQVWMTYILDLGCRAISCLMDVCANIKVYIHVGQCAFFVLAKVMMSKKRKALRLHWTTR